MKDYVLDASALLEYLEGSPGAEKVEQVLASSHRREVTVAISVMNWGEVFYNLWQHHGEEVARRELGRLARLPLQIVQVDEQQALKAGEIKALHHLSFVDCIAAALTELRGAILVTSDRDFKKLGRRVDVLWIARS